LAEESRERKRERGVPGCVLFIDSNVLTKLIMTAIGKPEEILK
jgi:hypothetical protein